jgi:hypothetical protein
MARERRTSEEVHLDEARSKRLSGSDPWPSLALEEWRDTYATLHMWSQIVGKIRLVQTPWVNHSWHVPQ